MYSSVINRGALPTISPLVSQENAPQNSLSPFTGEFAESLTLAINRNPENTIQTQVDVKAHSQVNAAIQRDLKEAFGIEPHQPGEPLKPLLKSMWALQDLDNNGVISGSEIKSNLSAASDIFQKHLGSFIDKENISTNPPIELSIASDGMVRVQNDHPDKEKIEKHINDNSELRNLYAGINSSKNLLAMAEESLRFQKRYAIDPKAAVAEFSHLFSGNYSYKTKLTIEGENWNYLTSSSFFV